MSDKYDIFIGSKELEPVGTLWLNNVRGTVSSVFRYSKSWLKNPLRFALGPDLTLNEYPKNSEGLFLCFQDCSPDCWGKVLLRRQESRKAQEEKRRPRTLSESDFLLRVNDLTRQGALRISADAGRTFLSAPGAQSVPPLLFLPKLLGAVRNIGDKKETRDDLNMLIAPGSSLGGARPKASVLGANGELLIAKFPAAQDERDIPLWEYVTFRLAERAGLRIPQVCLQKVAASNVLLVRRFDRAGSGRIPFLSAMSLLSAKDGETRSYADIAEALRSEGAQPQEDLCELWSRMVFNICVYNTDDHLRNHGFLRDFNGWRLSPLYDLETSHPTEKAPFLHTAMIDDVSSFNLSDALEVSEFFGLSKNEARKRLEEIRRAVSSWKQEAKLAGADSQEIRFMQDAYEYL